MNRMPTFIIAAAGCALLTAGAARAETTWSSFPPRVSQGEQCIRVGAEDLQYYELDAGDPVVLRVRGPRRLKVITRYIFGPDDPAGASYRISMRVDGREELRRTFRSTSLANVGLCDRNVDVAALRRVYMNVPTGVHDIQVLAESEGAGNIVARFFRRAKSRETPMVNYSPEEFDGVYSLQFESGTRSTYYHFSEDSPLRFSVIGPTTLEIYTRLDFDHTMTGSQVYNLEVLENGESLPPFVYHAEKLSSAAYIERRDILPGERKTLRLTVPRGRQEYEIRCSGPRSCGIAVKIRIPEADLQGK